MHGIWKDMFFLGLPILEKILRPIVVYIFLIVGLRLSGKRELAQLIVAASLLAINYLVVRFLYDHRKIDQLIEGRADVLIENGKVHMEKLKRELITKEELAAAARKQGFETLSEVRQCILEPGGTLTFIAKKPDTEDIRHQELLKKFDALTEELARLRKLQPPATA